MNPVGSFVCACHAAPTTKFMFCAVSIKNLLGELRWKSLQRSRLPTSYLVVWALWGLRWNRRIFGPPPPMSLLRCVSQLMHLKGLPTAAYMEAVCGLRETSLVYFCSSAPFYAGDVRCLARNRQSPTACLHRYSVNYAFFLITFPVSATAHDSFVGLPKWKRPPPTSAYCFELVWLCAHHILASVAAASKPPSSRLQHPSATGANWLSCFSKALTVRVFLPFFWILFLVTTADE